MRYKLTALWSLAFSYRSCSGLQFRLRSDRAQDHDPVANRSDSSADGALAGSSWKGLIKCDDGDECRQTADLPTPGNLSTSTRLKAEIAKVELESAGQTIRFAARQ